MLTSMLGQLPCKKKELPSAYVHVRAVAMYVHVGAVAMYHAKTHGNSGKKSYHLLIKHTRGSCHVRCKNTWQLAAWVWERRRACGRDGKCPHTSPCVCVQSGVWANC